MGKRSDGFHEIETLFQSISVYDYLFIEPDENDTSFTTDADWCPHDDSNLVVRAATLLKEVTGISAGCKIHLEKHIPAGAGLGGGSSNAGTTLVALNTLWNTRLSGDDLGQLGAKLGSDVPFFIRGGTALGTGRGEILTPVTIHTAYWGILLCPSVHISTPWAYQQMNFSLTKSFKNSKFSVFTSRAVPAREWPELLTNDFEPIFFKAHPELASIPTDLIQAGAFFAGMSGSGSSIYGLFDTESAAKKAIADFSRQYNRVFLFQPV